MLIVRDLEVRAGARLLLSPTSFAVSIGASCLLSLLPTRQLSTPARLALGTVVLAAFVAGFWSLARAFTHA